SLITCGLAIADCGFGRADPGVPIRNPKSAIGYCCASATPLPLKGGYLPIWHIITIGLETALPAPRAPQTTDRRPHFARTAPNAPFHGPRGAGGPVVRQVSQAPGRRTRRDPGWCPHLLEGG